MQLSKFAILGIATLVSLFATQSNSQVKVVIFGGGTSHDFSGNYKEIDARTLTAEGVAVSYTERLAPAGLVTADVFVQASNQMPGPDSEMQSAIMQFVNAGGGLIAVHAGTWYNWPGWPDYNRLLIGGGTRGHDKPGEFEVSVVKPDHPVMQGIPAHFQAFDELYHQEMDSGGPHVEVLATARSPITGRTYPSIWVVTGQPGRIVCIALGHDEKVHDNPAYQRVLLNAVLWARRK